MRRILAALALVACLAVPASASANDVPPLPPALYCTMYRATVICFLWQSPTILRWSTPWYSGATTAYIPT